MTEALTLRHDDVEAALPHQIEMPAEWGIILPDPVPFEVTLPKWCPVDSDALVALHWWASLCAHLQVLLPMVEDQQKVHYRLDKAMRHEIQVLRDIYGTSVSAAIAAAGSMARANVPAVKSEERELGCWSMAVQVAFGLLCVRAAAKGLSDPIVAEIRAIYEWIDNAFLERLGDETAHRKLNALCTGTTTGKVEEKLEQWRGALATAAEGAPEGAPGVAEALDVAAYEEPSAGAAMVADGSGLKLVGEDGDARPFDPELVAHLALTSPFRTDSHAPDSILQGRLTGVPLAEIPEVQRAMEALADPAPRLRIETDGDFDDLCREVGVDPASLEDPVAEIRPNVAEVVVDGPPADPENPNYYQKCPLCATVVSGLSELTACPVCWERRGGNIVPQMQPITREHFGELLARYEATATPGIEHTMAAAEAHREHARRVVEKIGDDVLVPFGIDRHRYQPQPGDTEASEALGKALGVQLVAKAEPVREIGAESEPGKGITRHWSDGSTTQELTNREAEAGSSTGESEP